MSAHISLADTVVSQSRLEMFHIDLSTLVPPPQPSQFSKILKL